jgi:hypothetical protein
MSTQAAIEGVVAALLATGAQLALVLGPAAACAVVLHQLERITQTLLVSTFGVRAALVTGWLGVPVHEVSHVVSCMVFMHDIEEVQLFTPNEADGTLGLVRHHAPAGNPWAEVGRFFIGVAPLVGGALALFVVARLLLPADALTRLAAVDLGAAPHATASAWTGFSRGAAAAASLFRLGHLDEPRFWLFLYLTACIGSHLAPSRADLRGAARGAVALVAVLFVVNLVASLTTGGIDPDAVARVAAFTTPLVALLVLAVFLSAAILVSVLALTFAVERFRGAQDGQLARFARDHAFRLAVAGAGCVAFAFAAGVLRWPA